MSDSNTKIVGPGAVETPDGTLHIDLVQICIRAGVPPTVENQRRFAQALREQIATKMPGRPLLQVDEQPPRPAMKLIALAPEPDKRVRIVQVLCPQRHAIIAVSYEPWEIARSAVVDRLIETMNVNRIPHICGICHSSELFMEDAPTAFESMREAMPALQAVSRDNAKAREMIEASRRQRMN